MVVKQLKIKCSRCGKEERVDIGSLCHKSMLCVNCFKEQDTYFKFV